MAKFEQIFNNTDIKKADAHPRRDTKWIHYTKLIDNSAQYCNEREHSEIEALAGMIDADEAVLQNLLVRKTDTDEYEIIAGHKRRRACRWLAEEEGKKQYEFLPCTVENLSDVRAEFQVYSSNSHHEKDDYEKMHELERMKYLLEKYPEEFPHLQTGRMVERLAKQMHMKRTTVGEYLTISANLGSKGKEEFRKGLLKKSAAVELSGLPEEEQEELLEQGITAHKEIKTYKEQRNGKTTAVPETEEAAPEQETPETEEAALEQEETDAGIRDRKAAEKFLSRYREWNFRYRNELMEEEYFSRRLSDGMEILAMEYTHTAQGSQEDSISVKYFLTGPGTRHICDGYMPQDKLKEYLVRACKADLGCSERIV